MNFKSIGKMVLASSLLFSGMYANAEAININDNLALETVGNLINPTVDSFIINNNAGLAVTDTDIESFLSIESGALDQLSTGNATVGSAINASFDIGLGDVFSFDWIWTSNEGDITTFNDFAFVSLQLNDIDLGLELLADTSTPDNTFGTFSFISPESGILNLGLGVLNVNDSIVDSSLTVFNGNSIEVPEPSNFVLFALGLIALSIRKKLYVKK